MEPPLLSPEVQKREDDFIVRYSVYIT
ncbi:unnamed protein product [Cuscuta epithymum]|uniref:Uncharacterized protein n=1 Tax=Cuscuta epithymum TaxID=186058 RepID=A0AAV0FUZ0_9ASTE|nr:unnamed protein product [Cuscuta epithymum]